MVERVEYQNADGTFVLTEDGKRKKTFRQRRPDPEHPGKWLWNVEGVPVVPYRLPELIEGDRQSIIRFSLSRANARPICFGLGVLRPPAIAGGAKKWKPEHAEFLRGADVVLVPDNDDAGWQAHQRSRCFACRHCEAYPRSGAAGLPAEG